MWRDTLTRTAWLTAGSAIGRLLPYVALIGMGRSVIAEEFAAVALGFAWSGVAANLSVSGLCALATQRLALTTLDNARRDLVISLIALGLGIVGLFSIAVAALGSKVFAFSFGRIFPDEALAPAIFNGLAWSLTLLAVAVLNGLHKARASAAVLGAGGMFQGVGLFVGHNTAHGISGSLWGLACGSALALIWAGWIVIGCLGPRSTRVNTPVSNFDTAFWKALLWNSLASASVTPVVIIASGFLTQYKDGARQLAAFLALEQLHQLAIFVPGIIGQALLPTLTVHLLADWQHGVRKMIIVSFLTGIVGASLGLLLGWNPSWLHRLVGNDSLGDTLATRWMLAHAGLALSMTIMGNAMLARGLNALASCLNIGWAAIFLALAWVWADSGAQGIHLGRLCASAMLLTLTGMLLWWITGKPIKPPPSKP